jgi:hypothetical protein
VCAALAFAAARPARAEPAPFDLAGPVLDVSVTHAGETLPIAATPNLAVGDQLSIKAELGADQSARYLLVVAFLRGATNPAPKGWFARLETWTPAGKAGLRIPVPEGAQQALVLLAPKTGGDFNTLVGAVRGRPGAFVRASQALNQAYRDRSRLEAFLTAVRAAGRSDPQALTTISPLLARSLVVKLNPGCLQKAPELQAACLSAGQDALVLDDGHDVSMARTLTSGEASDLVQQLGATPKAGGGYYSAYIGVVLDMVRIFDSLHTAQYQYIPALAVAQGDRLSLMLNAAPSFHNPQSVLVAALPPIEDPAPPNLTPVEADATYCVQKPDLVLPVDGAPLAFSTGYARNLALRLRTTDGAKVDLPVKIDAAKGGLVVDSAALRDFHAAADVDATLHGGWGFKPFEGPRFRLQTVQPQHWTVAPADQESLIVGRDASIKLQGGAAACTERVTLRPSSGADQPLAWKLAAPDSLTVTLPLKDAQPGPLTLLVQPFAGAPADTVSARAYSQAGRLDGFKLYSGEGSGVLTGARLDEVAGLTLRKASFAPGALTTSDGVDALVMTAADGGATAQMKVGDTASAKVELKDGRSREVKVTVAPARPDATLMNVSATRASGSPDSHVRLAREHEIPAGSTVTFALRAQTPSAFTGDETVEVAPAEGIGHAVLTFAAGLVLQDAHVAVATLDTGKAFTGSTFGPLRFRLVDKGVAGDWRPLAVLVRLPSLGALRCPPEADRPCQLAGSGLYLIASLSADPHFSQSIQVPEGATGPTITVPHPSSGRLYLKLRDDPGSIHLATLPDGEEASKHAASAAPSGASTTARPLKH